MVIAALHLHAQQVEFSAGYLTRSAFTDREETPYGKGELYRIGVKYNQPLSLKLNDRGEPIVWTASVQGALYDLRSTGEAACLNPDDILNASVNVTHIRPLSKRWCIIATLGVGIYGAPRAISLSSVLANGGCLFIYRVNDIFSIGAGVGLTNAYGTPMVVPMTYVKWSPKSRFEFDLNVSGGIKASAQTWFGRSVRLRWNILEMDGITSVIKMDGNHRLYSSMLLSSYLTPSFYLNKKLSIFIDAGVNLVRACKITDRKIKYIFEGQKEEDKRHFRPAGKLGIGIRYGF